MQFLGKISQNSKLVPKFWGWSPLENPGSATDAAYIANCVLILLTGRPKILSFDKLESSPHFGNYDAYFMQ